MLHLLLLFLKKPKPLNAMTNFDKLKFKNIVKYVFKGGKKMLFNENNNNGIANEVKFANIFDKKLVKDLDIAYQELLYNIFNDLKEDDYIECWKSKYKEKADIKIRINGNIKGISIKMGEKNSVHQEHVNSFSNYLLNIGLSKELIDKLRAYIFGFINGVQIDAQTYKKRRYNDIVALEKAFCDYYTRTNLIIRFLFKGKETQFYDADALIHGTPTNFIWATKSEILKYLVDYPLKIIGCVKVGPLFIQCRNRNLQKNINTMYTEEYIQVKWYTMKKDLYLISKERQKKSELLQNVSTNDKKV